MAKNDSDINIRNYDKGDHNKVIQLVSNIIINRISCVIRSYSYIRRHIGYLCDISLMSYRRLCKKPLLFRSLTGLTVPEFDQISTEMDSKYEEYERRRLSKRKRKRDVGWCR